MPFVVFMPETYGPVLLKRKAKKLRRENKDPKIFAPVELEKQQTWNEFAVVVLLRPVRMFLFEWIVMFSCLYLSVEYAIFYSKSRTHKSPNKDIADFADWWKSLLPSLSHHL